MTYKVCDVSVRLYTSTSKLKLFGSNFNVLREGLHKLLDKSPSLPLPEPEPESEVTEPLPTFSEILKSLVDDVTALKKDVSDIKSQAPANADSEDTAKQLKQDLQFSRQEIEALRDEIKIHKDTIGKLQSERLTQSTCLSLTGVIWHLNQRLSKPQRSRANNGKL